MTASEVEPAWFNYMFETDLDCPNGCGCGAHPLYVGKSNDALRRLLEHAKTQPWFKHVTGWKIFPERYATEVEALAAETQRIHALLPLANDRDNRANPCRMEFVAAPARSVARRARDVPAAVPARRPWTRRQRMVAGYTTFWALFTVLLWWTCAPQVPGGWAALAGSAGAVVPMLAGVLHRPKRRRRRR